jgi:LPXTG-motif cell wall-anchored protein
MLVILFVGIVVAGAARAGAGQRGAQIPSNCVAHVSFDGGPDLVDDFRCAGLAIEFHTAGAAFSPGPIWAGQWLFVDETGQFRVGSCTFNRGIHPTIGVPSSPVAQYFPNDPTGAKAAYLTWRYGDTTDNLTAAAMWAVLHYYAQDAAGSMRTSNAEAPLVPSLGMIARASGRADIQALAVSIDAEAAGFAGEWAIEATLDVAGNIAVTLTAADHPVADATITLLESGQDSPVIVTTDADGVARSVMPVAPGAMTVVASSPVPGPALVYRGKPAAANPHGAQNLVTGGLPGVASATATLEVPMPVTTASTPTTDVPATTATTAIPITEAPTTEAPMTTSTSTLPAVAATAPDTRSPDTVPPDSSVPVTVAVEAVPPPPEAPLPPPAPPLPKTGRGSDSVSYLATALLVAGIGIVGVASRRARRRVIYTR